MSDIRGNTLLCFTRIVTIKSMKHIRSNKMSLKGSKTEENLKAAFAGESQANRRYLYFAQKADVEGYNDVSTVFRSTQADRSHTPRIFEAVGDPATGTD